MSDDYVSGERRRTKRDLRKKRRNRVYKQGGKYRASEAVSSSNCC